MKQKQDQASKGMANYLADKIHLIPQALEGQGEGRHSSLFFSVTPRVLCSVPHTYMPIHISWDTDLCFHEKGVVPIKTIFILGFQLLCLLPGRNGSQLLHTGQHQSVGHSFFPSMLSV